MKVQPRRGPVQVPESLGRRRPSPRVERVNKQLREEISQLMVREMKDPRVRLASISRVSVSPDLRSARVMVSAVGDDVHRHRVVAALRHAEGYLRSEIGGRLENLKNAPHLTFELDESIAYSVRISSMLRDLEAAVPGNDGQEAAPAPYPAEGDG